MDLRVQGVPLTRLAHMLKNQSKEKALIKDLQKTVRSTHSAMCRRENQSSTTWVVWRILNYVKSLQRLKCSSCSKYWADGVVCGCGDCLPATEKTRFLTEHQFDLLSMHFFEGQHGKTDEQREYHQAKSSILERFQKQDSYRESQIEIGWTEDTCRHLDQMAIEDRSYTVTWSERQRYEHNWKLKTDRELATAR